MPDVETKTTWVALTGDNYPVSKTAVLLLGPDSPVGTPPPVSRTVVIANRGVKNNGWWIGTPLTGARFFEDGDKLIGADFWTHYAEFNLAEVG